MQLICGKRIEINIRSNNFLSIKIFQLIQLVNVQKILEKKKNNFLLLLSAITSTMRKRNCSLTKFSSFIIVNFYNYHSIYQERGEERKRSNRAMNWKIQYFTLFYIERRNLIVLLLNTILCLYIYRILLIAQKWLFGRCKKYQYFSKISCNDVEWNWEREKRGKEEGMKLKKYKNVSQLLKSDFFHLVSDTRCGCCCRRALVSIEKKVLGFTAHFTNFFGIWIEECAKTTTPLIFTDHEFRQFWHLDFVIALGRHRGRAFVLMRVHWR